MRTFSCAPSTLEWLIEIQKRPGFPTGMANRFNDLYHINQWVRRPA